MHFLVINWQDRTHPQAGGAEVHLHEIFGRIARQGHRVTLLCCAHRGARSREPLDGMSVIRIGRRPWFNYIVPLWWLLNYRKLDVDIVVEDINKLPFFTPKYVRKPILALVHHFFGNSIFSEVGTFAGRYVQWFEKRIPIVYGQTPLCTVSESTRQECIELGFAPHNVHVIHNAIDPRYFPMKVTAKAQVPTLVYFGRLKRYKSVDHILRAMVILRKQIPNIRLEVLGTGDEQQSLEQLAATLGLTSAISFRGFVSNEQKSKYLSTAHLAVNPSIKEGWGITNIEANASGTPVVSADVPGLRDSVRPNVSGVLYPYGNIEELARIIHQLLSDSAELQRLSEGAVAWASTFTWDASAEQMLALCENIVRASSK